MAWKTVYEVAQAEFSQNESMEGTRSWREPYSSSRRMVLDIKGADKIRITLGNTAPVVLPQHEEAKLKYGEGTYKDYVFTPSFANYPVAVDLDGTVYIPLGDGTSVAYDIKIEVEEQGSVHIKETVDANEYIEWRKVYNGSIPVEKGFIMPYEADITIDGGEKYHVTKNEIGDYGELDPNTHATSFENYPFYISYDVSNLLLKFNFQNEGSYLVEISAGPDDPTPSKKSASIGVKEAMKHYVKAIDSSLTPKTTIKGLTKQALDPSASVDAIQNARTIADIWEQAANAGPSGGGTSPDGEIIFEGDVTFTNGEVQRIYLDSSNYKTIGEFETHIFTIEGLGEGFGNKLLYSSVSYFDTKQKDGMETYYYAKVNAYMAEVDAYVTGENTNVVSSFKIKSPSRIVTDGTKHIVIRWIAPC